MGHSATPVAGWGGSWANWGRISSRLGPWKLARLMLVLSGTPAEESPILPKEWTNCPRATKTPP
jgi:hypothetical protein